MEIIGKIGGMTKTGREASGFRLCNIGGIDCLKGTKLGDFSCLSPI